MYINFFFLPLVLFISTASALTLKDIEIDISQPTFEEGIIFSDKGTVIRSEEFLFQVNRVEYNISKKEFLGEEDLFFLSPSGAIKGKKIIFNFANNKARIQEGIFAYPPWVIESPEISFKSDLGVTLRNPVISSDSAENPIWELKAANVHFQGSVLRAHNVFFTFMDIPFMWIPSLTINPERLRKSPLKYHLRWGGDQGTRLGITYSALQTEQLRTDLRLDYRFKRGFGGGVETYFHSIDREHRFDTINYLANDRSQSDPSQSTRCRFQGLYTGNIPKYCTKVKLSYDKLSDKDMAADYCDESLGVEEAKRTELRIQTCTPCWRANLLTRVQLNSFQSVKQELPSLEIITAPFTLGNTGILSLSEFCFGYLNYDYASNVDANNFASSRYEITQRFSRRFALDNLRITPEAGLQALYYSQSPTGTPKELVVFFSNVHAEYPLVRKSANFTQTLTPYAIHTYVAEPTTSVERHYIFDIHDGITSLHHTKFGISTSQFLCRPSYQEVFFADLYTVGFWDKERLDKIFPHLHGEVQCTFFSNFHFSMAGCWNSSSAHMDEWKGKTLWTISAQTAVALELRNRRDRFFRKVDRENYSLEQHHTLSDLLNSSLADRRNTLLFHGYHRLQRNIAVEYQSRIGWGRKNEPSYHESQLDLHTKIASIWHCKLSYQVREDDHRIAFYINLLQPKKRGCRRVFFDQEET